MYYLQNVYKERKNFMKVILKFNYKGNTLLLLKNNEDYIFAKDVNGKLIYDLTDEEKNIISKVIKNILPSNKIVEIEELSHAGKLFRHYLDVKNGWHHFSEIVNGEMYIPTLQDLKFLNQKYNHQYEYVNSTNDFKTFGNDFIQRIIKIGTDTILFMVSASISFGFCWSVDISLQQTQTVDESIVIVSPEPSLGINDLDPIVSEAINLDNANEENGDNLSENAPDDIIAFTTNGLDTAVMNNPNLTDEEKEFFLSVTTIYNEEISPEDYPNIYDYMGNFYIIYDPNKSENGDLGCFYYTGPNKYAIVIYEANSFEDAPPYVLSHEFCHTKCSYRNPIFGMKLYEAINAIYNNEHFGSVYGKSESRYDDSYSRIVNYAYVLCEILDKDTIRMFHQSADPQVIVNALMLIIPNEQKAVQCVSYFDDVQASSFGAIISLSSTLKEYYEAKYKSDIREDDCMRFLILGPESVNDTSGITYKRYFVESTLENDYKIR